VNRQHTLNIAEIEIPRTFWQGNRKTSTLRINERHNLILLGVVNRKLGDRLHFPIGDEEHILNGGDVLVVMRPTKDIKSFREALLRSDTDCPGRL
jgi:voltage-gated potassium channel